MARLESAGAAIQKETADAANHEPAFGSDSMQLADACEAESSFEGKHSHSAAVFSYRCNSQ